MTRTTKSIDVLIKRRLAAIEEFKRVQDAYDELAPKATPPVDINDGTDRSTIIQPVGKSNGNPDPFLKPGDAIRAKIASLE
eukprot:1013531-Prymnesium_polylepis.1